MPRIRFWSTRKLDLQKKWTTRYDRRKIRRYRGKLNVPADNVCIQIERFSDGHKALLSCRFGRAKVTTWLVPSIADSTAWEELIRLAAQLCGITDPTVLKRLLEATKQLGLEHSLYLRPNIAKIYGKSAISDSELLKAIEL